MFNRFLFMNKSDLFRTPNKNQNRPSRQEESVVSYLFRHCLGRNHVLSALFISDTL